MEWGNSGRITPNYIVVEPWIWNDPRVRSLGKDAKGLYGMLMTCPQMTKVPGLIFGGTGSLTDEWNGGTREEFLTLFAELERANLCQADWDNRCVYVLPLLQDMECNAPCGPPQASAYGTVIFRLAPDCELVRRVDHDMRQLMLHSPAMMQSYLRCRPMSNDDAKRDVGRPLPPQPRQISLNLPEAGPATAAPSEPQAGGASGSTSSTAPAWTTGDADAPPALRVVADSPERELEEGLEALVASASYKLALGPSGFSSTQLEQLRSGWKDAYAVGWRKADLGDLGRWIAGGGLSGLTKTTPGAYVASYLGDALTRMDERRSKGGLRPPARAATLPARRPAAAVELGHAGPAVFRVRPRDGAAHPASR